MRRSFMVAVFSVFGWLPPTVRRHVIRAVSPKYTVGALCIVEREGGSVLLVRHSYNRRWGTVGGLAKRRERPEVCAVRETFEEVGLRITIAAPPVVLVMADLGRVDVVFHAHPTDESSADEVGPRSPEILETRWFMPSEPPRLSPDTEAAWSALAEAGLLEPPGEQPG